MNNEIRRIRKLRGMSQETLANLAGIFQTQISVLENGKRQPSETERVSLAAVLGVTVQDLFPLPDLDGVQRRAYK